MQQIYEDTTLGAVILNESLRAKSISIKVSRVDGKITLTYPKGNNRQSALNFLEAQRDHILKIIERQKSQRALNPPATAHDITKLRTAAKEYLPRRIAEIAAKTNLKYNKVTLRASRTRWGSCSSQGNISLSIYLMALPQHLIDFVIIHELCHTVHHNHSPRFHSLVDFICQGREQQLNRELKQHSIR